MLPAAAVDDEDEEEDEDDDLAPSPLGAPSTFELEDFDFESDELDDSDAEPAEDEDLAAVRLSVL
ncbi:MAG: hypothetical protein ACRD0V_10660 [Acidimicrobiales bacterium]